MSLTFSLSRLMPPPTPERRVPQIGDDPNHWTFCCGCGELTHVTETHPYFEGGGIAVFCPPCTLVVPCDGDGCDVEGPIGLMRLDGETLRYSCRLCTGEPNAVTGWVGHGIRSVEELRAALGKARQPVRYKLPRGVIEGGPCPDADAEARHSDETGCGGRVR